MRCDKASRCYRSMRVRQLAVAVYPMETPRRCSPPTEPTQQTWRRRSRGRGLGLEDEGRASERLPANAKPEPASGSLVFSDAWIPFSIYGEVSEPLNR